MLTRQGSRARALLGVLAAAPLAFAAIKDAESATHASEAARHGIVATYEFQGGAIVQIELGVLSHYSYILRSGGEALIVDPDRDTAFYTEAIEKEGLAIKGVFLTHSHADFIAGHLELVTRAGCPIFQSAASRAGYPIEPLKEGSTFKIGTAVIKAIETPGHTPDGICGAVYAKEGDATPYALLTGDTLFVGSVGRPDLLEGDVSAAWLASRSFDTWHDKLALIGDNVLVLPAHGAGSLCGAHLSDEPSSTIGREKASNPYLKYESKSDFIAAVLADLSEPPGYFAHNARMNREGPPLVNWNAAPAAAAPAEVQADRARRYIADVRAPDAYAAGHIPASVNIGLRGRFETWIGTMAPWGAPLVLLGDTDELGEAVLRLHRVGYKAATLALDAWKAAGLPVASSVQITPADLYAQMQRNEAPVIVDVRLPSEWMGLRIGQVVNLPLNRLAELSAKLDPAQPVVTVCNSAYRSIMAVGVLEGKGFTRAASLAGGSEAWIEAGYPVFGAAAAPSAAQAPSRAIRLADRMSPADLKRTLADLPGTFDLVDIRPPEAFADYSLPQARNVDIVDLMSNPAFLVGQVPLLIVDRDGSLAMQVAGILSQKTTRPIKALHGGMEAFWGETELGRAVRAVPLPAAPAGRAAVGAPPSGPAAAPAAPAAPARKKSAGC